MVRSEQPDGDKLTALGVTEGNPLRVPHHAAVYLDPWRLPTVAAIRLPLVPIADAECV